MRLEKDKEDDTAAAAVCKTFVTLSRGQRQKRIGNTKWNNTPSKDLDGFGDRAPRIEMSDASYTSRRYGIEANHILHGR